MYYFRFIHEVLQNKQNKHNRDEYLAKTISFV